MFYQFTKNTKIQISDVLHQKRTVRRATNKALATQLDNINLPELKVEQIKFFNNNFLILAQCDSATYILKKHIKENQFQVIMDLARTENFIQNPVFTLYGDCLFYQLLSPERRPRHNSCGFQGCCPDLVDVKTQLFFVDLNKHVLRPTLIHEERETFDRMAHFQEAEEAGALRFMQMTSLGQRRAPSILCIRSDGQVSTVTFDLALRKVVKKEKEAAHLVKDLGLDPKLDKVSELSTFKSDNSNFIGVLYARSSNQRDEYEEIMLYILECLNGVKIEVRTCLELTSPQLAEFELEVQSWDFFAFFDRTLVQEGKDMVEDPKNHYEDFNSKFILFGGFSKSESTIEVFAYNRDSEEIIYLENAHAFTQDRPITAPVLLRRRPNLEGLNSKIFRIKENLEGLLGEGALLAFLDEDLNLNFSVPVSNYYVEYAN